MPQWQSHDWMPADFAHAADHFFIGKHGAERGTPIHRRFVFVSQTVFVLVSRNGIIAAAGDFRWDRQFADRPAALRCSVEPCVVKLQEYPLRPAEIAGIGRGQLALPVVTQAEGFQRAAEIGDIPLGADARRRACFDGMFLGRKPECIKTHWVQHCFTAHPLKTADDVGCGVAFRMADVQPVAAGIREHIQNVDFFGPSGRQTRGGKRALGFPIGLPLRFHQGGVVSGHKSVRRIPATLAVPNVVWVV